MTGDLHSVAGWIAPGITAGPTQRPVDGHNLNNHALLARALTLFRSGSWSHGRPRSGRRRWAGKDSNLRRRCRQVYSLLPLATRAPTLLRAAMVPPPYAPHLLDGRPRYAPR